MRLVSLALLSWLVVIIAWLTVCDLWAGRIWSGMFGAMLLAACYLWARFVIKSEEE